MTCQAQMEEETVATVGSLKAGAGALGKGREAAGQIIKGKGALVQASAVP